MTNEEREQKEARLKELVAKSDRSAGENEELAELKKVLSEPVSESPAEPAAPAGKADPEETSPSMTDSEDVGVSEDESGDDDDDEDEEDEVDEDVEKE